MDITACTTKIPLVRLPTVWLKLRFSPDPEADEAPSKTRVHPRSGVAVKLGLVVGEAVGVAVCVADSVAVGVAVGEAVDVADSVGVLVMLGVAVGLAEAVAVGVQVAVELPVAV